MAEDNKPQMLLSHNGIMQHHGIKGMQWGVRRTKKQLARAGGGKTAKDYASQAKSMKNKAWEKRFDEMNRKIDADYSSLKKAHATEVTKINLSNSGRFKKFLARMKAGKVFQEKVSLSIEKHENAYLKKESSIKSARKDRTNKEVLAIMTKYDNEFNKRVTALEKNGKLKTGDWFKEIAKIDKELSAKASIEIAKAEVRIEREVN